VKRNPVHHACLLLVMAVLAVLAADSLKPRQRMADSRPQDSLADLVPSRIGGWTWDPTGAVVQAAPDVQATLAATYTELLGRTYRDERGSRMMVSLAYVANSARGTAVHRPEVCYPAQGFAVRDLGYAGIDLDGGRVPVVRVVMERQSRREPVTYWIVVGTTVVDSTWAARWAQLRYTMSGTQPDALLVRLSSIDNDAARAFAEQERFVRDLAATPGEPLRTRLFGKLALDAQQVH
jgi:EpsI family protein